MNRNDPREVLTAEIFDRELKAPVIAEMAASWFPEAFSVVGAVDRRCRHRDVAVPPG